MTLKLSKRTPAQRAGAIDKMDHETRLYYDRSWADWAQTGQAPPADDWRVWMMMAGRGFGKTRAGAEWVRGLAEQRRAYRIALVAASEEEARRVMIEGESGLLAVSPPWFRPRWEASKGELIWPGGARGIVYSAANPESLRGGEHHAAWCDELGKWPFGMLAWDNLMFAMRLGPDPRTVVTTTPRPTALMRRLAGEPGVVVSGGTTTDNAHLPAAFVQSVTAAYGGTRLGRQEIGGELIEEVEGALWSRALIEERRVRCAPETVRVVIGVDPPASVGGDACGIVVAARGRDGCAYVIEDASVSGQSPAGWARAVASAAARHRADRVVAEKNNGGDMVASVLRGATEALSLRLVHASRGKAARAEPVLHLYERGAAFHVGAFPELEDELCGLMAGGGYDGPGRSPDRADALVWALSELMLGGTVEARVRVV